VGHGPSALENLEVSAQETRIIYSNPNTSFWRNRRVLLTGHTGFKGAWMALWLHRLGATVTGIALPPAATPNLFTLAKIDLLTGSYFCDIRDTKKLAEAVASADPEIVFHLAAQALVRTSYREPLSTFSVNTQGTANILETLRSLDGVRAVIAVTTDKVYRDVARSDPHRENGSLGGHDPYSASKAAAEIVIASYRDAFFAEKGVAVASARAGNVIGGGDWSEDRLIPDAIRAWEKGNTLQVRRPQAVRPWQHVLEPLAGYLILAEKLWQDPTLADAYNFGPEITEAPTVRQVVELARKMYGAGEVAWGDGSEGPHETSWLSLDITKARSKLGVNPRWSLPESVARTLGWYRQQADGRDASTLCEADIAAYEAMAPARLSV
jgi:CDP-glucose 4,6-dehydratase